MNARRSHQAAIGGVALAALGVGCSFQPNVPSNTVACARDDQCPTGYFCRPLSAETPAAKACCRWDTCDDVRAPSPDAAAPRDAAAATTPDARVAPSPDAETTLPPIALPPDGGADQAPSDGGVDVEALISCSSNVNTALPALSGRESYCTIYVGDYYAYLGIDAITANDPVSIRAHAVCNARLPLGEATTDPSDGTMGPLPPATVDLLVKVVQRYKQRCAPHNARLVGAVATGWARAATNQSEVKARFKEGTGLDLDIPSADQELAQRYYGAARYRRGRVVVETNRDQPEILSWPAQATAPTRTQAPLGFASAALMYFSSPSYPRFEDARKNARSRVTDDMSVALKELEAQVKKGALQPTVAVGPADPLLPLAVGGQLRTAKGDWFDGAQWTTASNGATVTTTPYGRAYGVILPAELDKFFDALDDAQFAQLRANPIRDAYGARLLYLTTLLDVLADEVKATEFGFAFTNPHFGYLFTKVFPAPSP